VFDEILHGGLAKRPPAPERHFTMGKNEDEWCHYRRCKGHDTEKCFKLWDLIEELIRSGHLRKFIEKGALGRTNKAAPTRSPRHTSYDEEKEKEQPRIAVNTIAGGFAGGGESSSARR
jgi:hypothetical protein